MTGQSAQRSVGRVWSLARRQHGVVTRRQLLELGLSCHAIDHRLAKGRLHAVFRGVYALGRPELSSEGMWMAAVLHCGPGAMLSHESAAVAWGIRRPRAGPIEVSIRGCGTRTVPGLRVHRRHALGEGDMTIHRGIPVTSPALTLVDLAVRLSPRALEAAVNEADKLDLVDPERLRGTLEDMARRPGIARLRHLLNRDVFVLTDSELERLFLPIVRATGLPPPLTRQRLNGFKVDFFWPGLGLVVETDGLRYHRTPAQQTRDRRRDQAHAAAGLTPLRFTHAQVRFQPAHVCRTLAAVAARLAGAAAA